MRNRISLSILLTLISISYSTASSASSIYLNLENISVEVGAGTSPGTFNNTFSSGQTIEKVIDAPSADAEEFHNQSTHIWFTASEIGGGLELLFDFKQSYDVSTLHFWNYTSEGYDVDEINFSFFDSSMTSKGSLSISPMLGTSPGITSEDILLDAPLNIQYVTAFLTGTNRQVDFQNIGFTAELSQVPLPAGVWLFASSIVALLTFRRRNFVSKK